MADRYECWKHGVVAGGHCEQCKVVCYMPAAAKPTGDTPTGEPRCTTCGKTRSEPSVCSNSFHIAPIGEPQPGWCSECQASISCGHRSQCSQFVLCTREVVLDLLARIAELEEALREIHERSTGGPIWAISGAALAGTPRTET